MSKRKSKQFYTPQSDNLKAQKEEKTQLPLLSSLLNVLIYPKKVFCAIEENGLSFWLPLLLILVFNAVFLFWYFDSVPALAFLTDLMKENADSDASGNFEVLLVNFELVKYLFIVLFSSALLFSLLLSAWVFYLVSNMLIAKRVSFLSWFACVSWASLPLAVASIVQIILFITSDAQQQYVALDALNVFNLNSLIFHLNSEDLGYELLTKMNPFYIWSLGLSVLGFKLITQVSWGKSVASTFAVILVSFALSIFLG